MAELVEDHVVVDAKGVEGRGVAPKEPQDARLLEELRRVAACADRVRAVALTRRDRRVHGARPVSYTHLTLPTIYSV